MIMFLHFKGSRQIYVEMRGVYAEDCTPCYTVVGLERNFQTGRMSLTNESKSERPSPTDDAATVKKVEDLILENPTSNYQP